MSLNKKKGLPHFFVRKTFINLLLFSYSLDKRTSSLSILLQEQNANQGEENCICKYSHYLFLFRFGCKYTVFFLKCNEYAIFFYKIKDKRFILNQYESNAGSLLRDCSLFRKERGDFYFLLCFCLRK